MSANGRGNRSRANADELIIAALAAGKTLQEAAKIAGVSAKTVSRRLLDLEFQNRVRKRRGEMIEQVSGRLNESMSIAVDALRKLLDAKSESVRLAACRAMIGLGLKIRSEVDVEVELEELRNLLALIKSEHAQDVDTQV
jgi:HEAT repeat protein